MAQIGVIFFILGTAVGSFINVVISRFEKDKKWWQGRSYCDHCRRQLRWWENIPFFSYFILKGRCRTCHFPISLEYPLVELGTGLLFLVVVWRFGFGNLLLIFSYLLLVTFLILVFLYDFHYQIIPDWTVLGLIGLAFFSIFINSNYQLLVLISTGLLTSLFFLFLHLITRGRGMGLGDVKFAFFMGLFLGWPEVLVGLYTAFLTGAIFGVILILMKKKKFGQHLAFGPFLVIGTLIAWFWGDIFISNIYNLLFII